MPTFSTIALENLLEPDVTRPTKQKDLKPMFQIRRQPEKETQKSAGYRVKRPQHVYFCPALYTTPEPTPIPDPPSSFSPSPYVINYKRREPLPQKTDGPVAGLGGPVGSEKNAVFGDVGDLGAGSMTEDDGSEARKRNDDGGESAVELDRNVEIGVEEGFVIDDLPAAREEDPLGGRVDAENECAHSPLVCQTEFFDANDEFSRDGSPSKGSPFFHPGLLAELDALRLDLSLEVEKRKKAEEAIEHMHAQWKRIAKQLSQVGFAFPIPDESGNFIQGNDGIELLLQQIAVARLVAEAVGRGVARAEAGAAAEALINAKNVEIARLRDRLQYYEAVNHEMTQRNLENFEAARRFRQRRRVVKKWFWSCLGLSVSVGACLLAYSYLPHVGSRSLASTGSLADLETSNLESTSEP
ncbi:uncharacterized protein LOC116262003 [Nymphaea colorata]|nr:uncharacterized protein LOC116262003 [Nymphaea colorata]